MIFLLSLLLWSDFCTGEMNTSWIDHGLLKTSSTSRPRRDFRHSNGRKLSSPDAGNLNSTCSSIIQGKSLSNSCVICDADGLVIPVSRVINECTFDWRDEWTRKKCEMPLTDELYIFLPVQSANGLMYRNLYCAMCNRVDMKLLIIWRLKTKCSTSCVESYLRKGTLKTIVSRLLASCTITLIPPKSRRNRFLSPIHFKLCEETTYEILKNEHDIIRNVTSCVGYSSFIEMPFSKNSHTNYRRWHCCHGDSVNGSHCIITGPNLCSDTKNSLISLEYTGDSLIVNFDGKTLVEKFKPCPQKEIYEPLKQKCLEIFTESINPTLNASPQETLETPLGNKSIVAIRIVSRGINAFAKSSGISINITDKTTVTSYNSSLTGKAAVFLSLFTVIGSSLSLVGLAFSFITYSLFSDLRSMAGTTMMNLFAALFLAQLLFLMGMDSIGNIRLCTAIAIGLHFTWLSAFFWMNVMAYDLFKTLDSGLLGPGCRTMKKMFLFYTLYAWGIPAIIVTTCALVRFGTHETFTYIGGPKCFILEYNAVLYAFAIPTALVTLLNIYIFIRTYFAIKYMSAYTRPYKKHRKSRPETIQLKLYFRVCSLMVVNWLFGFLSNFTDIIVFWYIFTILNTLQGLFISLSFTCNTRVFKFYAKRRKNKPGDISSYGASELSQMSQATSLTMLRWDPTPEIL